MTTLNYLPIRKRSRLRRFILALLFLSIIPAAWFGLTLMRHLSTPTASNEGNWRIHATLNIIRGQIEVYQIQHKGTLPTASLWTKLRFPTNTSGDTAPTTSPDFPLGPYVGTWAANPANGQSAIGPAPAPTIGWVYIVSGTTYKLEAVNTTGNGILSY